MLPGVTEGGGRGLCGFVVLVREETRRNDRRGKQAFIYMHKHTNAKKRKEGNVQIMFKTLLN